MSHFIALFLHPSTMPGLLDFPTELHYLVAVFLPRPAIARMCLVSGAFSAAYQAILFEHIRLASARRHTGCLQALERKPHLAARARHIAGSITILDWPDQHLSRLSGLTLTVRTEKMLGYSEAVGRISPHCLQHCAALRTLRGLQFLAIKFAGTTCMHPVVLWDFLASIPPLVHALCIDVDCALRGRALPSTEHRVHLSQLRSLVLRGCPFKRHGLLYLLGTLPQPWILGTQLRSLALSGYMYPATASLFQPLVARLDTLDISHLQLLGASQARPSWQHPDISRFFASLSSLRQLRISEAPPLREFFSSSPSISVTVVSLSLHGAEFPSNLEDCVEAARMWTPFDWEAEPVVRGIFDVISGNSTISLLMCTTSAAKSNVDALIHKLCLPQARIRVCSCGDLDEAKVDCYLHSRCSQHDSACSFVALLEGCNAVDEDVWML